MNKIVVYAFKIIGVLIISLLLWSLFIGAPSSNIDASTDKVTAETYFRRGSAFEQMVYGNEKVGFKHELGLTWLTATGINGLQTELRTAEAWTSVRADANGNASDGMVYFSGN